MAVDLREYLDPEVTFVYIKCVIILMIKMMLMSAVTGYYRMKKKAFANPEDAGKGEHAKKYLRTDPDVERMRRIHLNDVENLFPFVVIGFLYSLSGAPYSTAVLHYRLFVGARLFHTIAYFIPLPQPCRGLAWIVGYLVTFSMVYKLIMIAVNM